MHRPALIFVLCLMLLSMQREAYVHPLSHIAAPHDTALTTAQADAACLECALLAGGFDLAHAALPPHASDAPPPDLIFRSYHSRAGEVPAWFESRAPPTLL
jgi:hypothetical protein